METELKMTIKEADRYTVMKQVELRRLPLIKASQEMGVLYRQARRIWSRYQREGPSGLQSKRRGMPSNNQLPHEVKEKAIYFLRENYSDYGPTLAAEKLKEKHALELSKETLRQLMIHEALWKPKKKKEKKVHPRRTRRSCLGELEQIDRSMSTGSRIEQTSVVCWSV